MEVKAHLRYLRIAPRKVRLVIGLVRGKRVDQALDQLSVLPKGSSLPIWKLIQSAVANAEHNFQLDKKTLIVKSITANEGPRLKRYQPRAFGRAAEILKRSSHVTVVLEGQPSKTEKPAVKAEKKDKETLPTVAGQPKAAASEPKVAKPKAKKETKATDKLKSEAAEDTIIRRQGKE